MPLRVIFARAALSDQGWDHLEEKATIAAVERSLLRRVGKNSPKATSRVMHVLTL